jgi:hypothetical protein
MVEDCCCFGAQAVGAVNRGVETATRVALTFDVSPIADEMPTAVEILL